MKKYIAAILFVLLLNGQIFAFGASILVPVVASMTAPDRVGHITISQYITTALEEHTDFTICGSKSLFSFVVINTLGLIKEYADSQTEGSFDVVDLAANNCGYMWAHTKISFNF